MNDIVRARAIRRRRAWELHAQDTRSAVVCVGWGSISEDVDGPGSRLASVVYLDCAVVLWWVC